MEKGIEYSPDQYVLKDLAEHPQRNALRKCLKDAGMSSRLFKRVLPNEGSQPAGYHGLPPDYALVWEVEEILGPRRDVVQAGVKFDGGPFTNSELTTCLAMMARLRISAGEAAAEAFWETLVQYYIADGGESNHVESDDGASLMVHH